MNAALEASRRACSRAMNGLGFRSAVEMTPTHVVQHVEAVNFSEEPETGQSSNFEHIAEL